MNDLRLNLGAWDRPQPGYLSVDICGPHADVICDLNDAPWTITDVRVDRAPELLVHLGPLQESSVAAVYAHDVFEHLRDPRATMNELYRILAPGGRADICVPTGPGVGAWCDPTHVSVWTAEFFTYFERGNYARERFRGSDYYGVRADFKIVEHRWANYKGRFGEQVTKFQIILEALK